MRILSLPLLFVAFSLACPILAETPAEVRTLRREAYQIQREMEKRIPNIHDRDADLKARYEATVEASKKVQEALKNRPELAAARASRDSAFNALTAAISKGDAAGKQAAQEAYRAAEQNIAAEGQKVPEIAALMNASGEAGMAYLAKKEEVYAAQPETAEMAKKASALRARAEELRKAAK